MTAQISRYNFLFYNTGTSGVDALAQTDWATENNFINLPFWADPQDLKKGCPNKVCSHNYHPTLAQPTLVQKASENVSGLPSKNPKSPKCNVKKGNCSRADEKHQMENLCLENLWATRLSQQGWSDAAIQWFVMNCMPATWNTY